MKKYANLGALSIMYVVVNNRAEVVALLVKNGVQVPNNATDMQIALLVTKLLKISKPFGRDFNKLIAKKEVVTGVLGFNGEYSNFLPEEQSLDDLLQPTTTSTTTTKKDDDKKSSSWLSQGLNLLQTGFQGYLALDENKTQRELANASVKIKEGDVSLAEKGVLPAGTPPPKTGLSTGAIIGISVLGIAVVGGVIYLALKKR